MYINQRVNKLNNDITVLEIVVGHWTFSDQNCRLPEQFWFWSDKMFRQLKYDTFLILHLCN